jgi:hypothetical protein
MIMVSQNVDAAVLQIRDQIAVLGSNNYEFDAIEDILRDLHENKITLEDAISRAKEILFSKQDYH